MSEVIFRIIASVVSACLFCFATRKLLGALQQSGYKNGVFWRWLMRKDNLIYYGSMADSHIIMLQILETKKVGDLDVATKVSVQLQLTDPAAKSRDRIVKKGEKDGLYTALDFGCVWLERALAGK